MVQERHFDPFLINLYNQTHSPRKLDARFNPSRWNSKTSIFPGVLGFKKYPSCSCIGIVKVQKYPKWLHFEPILIFKLVFFLSMPFDFDLRGFHLKTFSVFKVFDEQLIVQKCYQYK